MTTKGGEGGLRGPESVEGSSNGEGVKKSGTKTAKAGSKRAGNGEKVTEPKKPCKTKVKGTDGEPAPKKKKAPAKKKQQNQQDDTHSTAATSSVL